MTNRRFDHLTTRELIVALARLGRPRGRRLDAQACDALRLDIETELAERRQRALQRQRANAPHIDGFTC